MFDSSMKKQLTFFLFFEDKGYFLYRATHAKYFCVTRAVSSAAADI